MKKLKLHLSTIVIWTFFSSKVFAQGGAGITTAATTLRTYMDPITTVMYVIGGIVGIIGGIKCYIDWNNQDPDIQKKIMGWGGAMIFLFLVPTIVRSFFNL